MEGEIIFLIVLFAAGICSSYVLKPYKYPYVTIATHEHCEERWYAPMTWVTINDPTEEDGEILGAYLRGFNSELVPVPINLKARVSGEIKDGNWTLQNIAFSIRGTIAKHPPLPYSERIGIVKEPSTIYCAQIPEEGEDTLYFKDVTMTVNDGNDSHDYSNILYVILDDPMQFLIKLTEKDDRLKSVYRLLRKRSITKAEFLIPKLLF